MKSVKSDIYDASMIQRAFSIQGKDITECKKIQELEGAKQRETDLVIIICTCRQRTNASHGVSHMHLNLRSSPQ